ncbi:hypothetical protein ACJ41O_011231 [Fusarium nematophilum]
MIYHILRLQFDIWACVVLDEAHERTTNTDMLLSLLKDVTRRRKDLKVVIMSAAFDLEKHENKPKGNILLFMTSVGEIEDVWGALGNLALELPALPMCSPLSKQGQDKAILEDKSVPQTGVFSTNVLEASPTVPGIVYDVDCGLEKQAGYNPRVGMTTLLTAQSQKHQRDSELVGLSRASVIASTQRPDLVTYSSPILRLVFI